MRTLILLMVFMFLAGCASFFNITDNEKAPAYHRPMYVDESYDISGRFSINSSHTHKYGNYTWLRTESNEEMTFNTPLGQTVAKINIESGIVTVITKDKTYVGNDVDDMLYDNIGFDLPVAYLHSWIQGLPLPNEIITKYIHDGFEQSGWTVEYLDWSNNNHPHILKCTNQDLVIKLLINWN